MKRLADLQARLRAQRRAFDARAPRERVLLAAAGVAAVFMLADALWLGPALTRWNAAQGQRKAALTQGTQLQQASQQAMAAQIAQVAQLRAELGAARQRVRDGEASLREFESTLVEPDRMLPLLEQMLARQGQVRVRALKSLGRSDLLAAAAVPAAPAPAPPAAAAAGAAAAATAAAAAAAAGAAADRGGALPSLYRHGIELTLEGSFADLLGYVSALEALPQRLLWGGMSFRVEQHPRAVLTLQLYTLSTARHWIEI
jgi:MSHA biogenesis protein MshJ